jgi:hypothetical protein
MVPGGDFKVDDPSSLAGHFCDASTEVYRAGLFIMCCNDFKTLNLPGKNNMQSSVLCSTHQIRTGGRPLVLRQAKLYQVPMKGLAVQYFCVGMSLWDEERIKQNSKQARAPTDDVELPFCEGLEIISASQLQQTPAVLTEAAAPVEAAPPIREPHRPGPTDRQAPHQVKVMAQCAPEIELGAGMPLNDRSSCLRMPEVYDGILDSKPLRDARTT